MPDAEFIRWCCASECAAIILVFLIAPTALWDVWLGALAGKRPPVRKQWLDHILGQNLRLEAVL